MPVLTVEILGVPRTGPGNNTSPVIVNASATRTWSSVLRGTQKWIQKKKEITSPVSNEGQSEVASYAQDRIASRRFQSAPRPLRSLRLLFPHEGQLEVASYTRDRIARSRTMSAPQPLRSLRSPSPHHPRRRARSVVQHRKTSCSGSIPTTPGEIDESRL